MVTVFFYCSSPYVGYTLKKADYANKEMKSVSANDMTSIGYKLFNSSGSFMTLGKFEGRKYFHTRQSQSENFDEQGRRIYTNVAFVGNDTKDEDIVNKIAMYVMFNEELFYKQISEVITLLDDGFTVDFDKLCSFVNKIGEAKIKLKSNNSYATKFFNDVMTCTSKELSFVITESTWSYFVKQAGYDFNESVLYKLSLQDAQTLTEGSTAELIEENKVVPPQAPAQPVIKKEVPSQAPVTPVIKKATQVAVPKIEIVDNSDKTDYAKLLEEKDKIIKNLKTDINNICAQRNDLESKLDRAKRELSVLKHQYQNLENNQKKLAITNILIGVGASGLVALVIWLLTLIF